MSRRRDRTPLMPASALIQRSLGREIDRQQQLLATVRNRLPAPVRARLIAVTCQNDVLTLFAENSAAASLLRLHSTGLSADLQVCPAKQVRCRVLPSRKSRPSTQRAPRRPSAPSAAKLLRELTQTEEKDSELASALQRLADTLSKNARRRWR